MKYFRKIFDKKYNICHTNIMKTAISIPNALFQIAEKTAKKLEISRSELYCNALKEYLRNKKEDDILNTLNEIYSNENSTLDEEYMYAQISSLPEEDW